LILTCTGSFVAARYGGCGTSAVMKYGVCVDYAKSKSVMTKTKHVTACFDYIMHVYNTTTRASYFPKFNPAVILIPT
jgi:hypothetical protein